MQRGSERDFKELCAADALVQTFSELIGCDTRSDDGAAQIPSSAGQLRLGACLTAYARSLGFEAVQDEKGVVLVRVPASEGLGARKALALIAHLDTAPDAPGNGVKPRLVRNYRGDGIELDNGLVIDDALCPELKEHTGGDIIVTDGTTLLGADDKAGVAVLLRLLDTLRGDVPPAHGPLCLVFSVDEEIGNSSKYISLEEVNCAYGLTIDGTGLGGLDIATFNASGALVEFRGRSVHTAVAYKTMVNAITLLTDFLNILPRAERPETTRGLEGFYHACNMEGSAGSARLSLILRDFDREKLRERERFVRGAAALINQTLGYEGVRVTLKDQYENMHPYLMRHREYIGLIKRAFALSGVECRENFVRGGTDGSNLSARGLPCPNLFTGALNCHGPYECLPVGSLHKAFEVTLNVVRLLAADGSRDA